VKHGISGCERGHIGKMRSVVWINNNMTRTGVNDDNVIKIWYSQHGIKTKFLITLSTNNSYKFNWNQP